MIVPAPSTQQRAVRTGLQSVACVLHTRAVAGHFQENCGNGARSVSMRARRFGRPHRRARRVPALRRPTRRRRLRAPPRAPAVAAPGAGPLRPVALPPGGRLREPRRAHVRGGGCATSPSEKRAAAPPFAGHGLQVTFCKVRGIAGLMRASALQVRRSGRRTHQARSSLETLQQGKRRGSSATGSP